MDCAHRHVKDLTQDLGGGPANRALNPPGFPPAASTPRRYVAKNAAAIAAFIPAPLIHTLNVALTI
jgi:hypothetical protein